MRAVHNPADLFSVRAFRVTFEWISGGRILEFPALDLTGFDFLFGSAFVIGLITLNTLTTVREEGEVGREVVMNELLAPSRGMTRALGSIPGMQLLVDYPYAYIRRVPGLDVALGVTAYQVASTVKTAVTAVGRGRNTAESVSQRVRSAVMGLVGVADGLQAGADLALYTAKGAMNAIGPDAAARVREALARGA